MVEKPFRSVPFLSSFLRHFGVQFDPVEDYSLPDGVLKLSLSAAAAAASSSSSSSTMATTGKYKYTDVIFEIKGKVGIIKVSVFSRIEMSQVLPQERVED